MSVPGAGITSHLVNNANGWTDRGVGDVHELHRYPNPLLPQLEEGGAAVMGEFGGLGLTLAGQTWWKEHNCFAKSEASKPRVGASAV